ncbi:lysozyme g-like [Engystomops pustulosus]|uniref:lysozyme g-like n=1 Tax=Engystomops pustulosus TaxID=76066 RepID=UPI003AFA225D
MTFYFILIFSVIAGTVISSGIYGDIGKIPTTGASLRTAKQDRLSSSGVKASIKLAETDLGRMNRYKSIIQAVAVKKKVDAALLCGVISRETRAGNTLKNGWGDNHNGFGLMQVDQRYHKPRGAYNSEEHITQGTEILISMYNSMVKKFPSSSKEMWLKGAIAAYNAGPGNVKTLKDVDKYTTGKDYANDVVARAQYCRSKGY